MRNVQQQYLLVLLLGLSPFFACKNKCDTGDFGIQKIQPDANPVGYEIFIACEGVGANTEVRFDEVKAVSVKTAEGGLIAKIPNGVVGNVYLSIEEGDCNDSKPFYVMDGLPTTLPANPPVIIVPQPPGNYPPPIANNWKNLFDGSHKIMFVLDNSNPGNFAFDSGCNEGDNDCSIELHPDNSFLYSNSVGGTYDLDANSVLVFIDRTQYSGGFIDTLVGSFIEPVPDANGFTDNYNLLLTSKITGRQLVLGRN